MRRRVQGSQIFKQNWIISIHSRVIVILLIWVSLALGGGAGGWGCPGWSTIVYMSSGMFRGKESSNRIELSRLVQDLLNFGVLGSLQLWGWGGWVYGGGGWLGDAPHTCAHVHTYMHTHTRTCMHGKHDKIMQMVAPNRFWGNPGDSLWCHTCVHMHAWHVLGDSVTTPTPIHPPLHPPGGTPRISQNSIALELIEIFQFCLKIWNLWRLPHPWLGGWVLMGLVRSNH